MTGIVFTGLLEMIEDTYGYSLVDRIVARSELPSSGIYTSGGIYDPTELMTLVNNLSQETSLAVPVLLHSFGRYLFTYFTKHRPHLLDQYESTFSLLAAVEPLMHVDVRKLYPQAELPEFKIDQLTQNHLRLTYSSSRKLGALAYGLIDGCLEYYHEKATITQTNILEDGSEVLFDIVKAA